MGSVQACFATYLKGNLQVCAVTTSLQYVPISVHSFPVVFHIVCDYQKKELHSDNKHPTRNDFLFLYDLSTAFH